MRKNTAKYIFLGLIAASYSTAYADTTPNKPANVYDVSVDDSVSPNDTYTNEKGEKTIASVQSDTGENYGLKHDVEMLAQKYGLSQTQIKDIQDDATQPSEPPAGAEIVDDSIIKIKSMQSDHVKTAGIVDLRTLEDENENRGYKNFVSRMTITVDAYKIKGTEDEVNDKYKLITENPEHTRKAFVESLKTFDAKPIFQKAKIPVGLNQAGTLAEPSTIEDLKTTTVTKPDGSGVKNISYGDAIYIMTPKKSDVRVVMGFHDVPCQFTEAEPVCTEYNVMEPVEETETSKIIKTDYNNDEQAIDVIRYSVKMK